MWSRARRAAPWVAALGVFTVVRPAAGAPPERDPLAAEAIYRDGVALLEAGQYDLACPKLAASYQLDPATGSLLALALCYERAGKVASAWKAYIEVEQRAHADRETAREEAAKRQVELLQPRLPQLRFSFGPGVRGLEGLVVRSDGAPLAAAMLDAAMPIDPGPHVLEVEAVGKIAKRIEITSIEGDLLDVPVASLDDAERPLAAVGAGAPSGGLGSVTLVGLVTGGVGLVGLGLGTAFGFVALGEASRLEEQPGYDAASSSCPPEGFAACRDAFDGAKSAGTISTVMFVAGGALTAAGLTMVLVGSSNQETGASLELRPTVGGATVVGRL